MRVYIGWDPHEMMAWNIAAASMQAHASRHLDIRRLSMEELQAKDLYTRPTGVVDGRLHDVISDAPMSTGHAIARFFVPMLEDYTGWALFVDGDILVRRNIEELFEVVDNRYALMCVQHPVNEDTYAPLKKDGAAQLYYPRKNWSSLMMFNCGHAANRALILQNLNGLPGRDLHRFCWLSDAEIGPLAPTWNHLVGVSDPVVDPEPAIAHFTLGTPHLPNAVASPYDAEWINYGMRCGYSTLRALLEPKVVAP